MAYRDDASARAARCAALTTEISALETDLEKQRAARAAIQATGRESRPGALRALNRPAVILALLLALLGGVYVGSTFRVKNEYLGGNCTGAATTVEQP